MKANLFCIDFNFGEPQKFVEQKLWFFVVDSVELGSTYERFTRIVFYLRSPPNRHSAETHP